MLGENPTKRGEAEASWCHGRHSEQVRNIYLYIYIFIYIYLLIY